jgi:hypothetical protein
LFDPLIVKLLATIHENIPGSWQAFMINFDIAFVVILSVTNEPPEVFCIVYCCDGKSVGTGRFIGSSGIDT